MNGSEISPAALILIAGAGYALLRLLGPQATASGAGTGDFGEVREQLDRLRAEQAAQAERLRSLNDLVVLVLPEREKTHLLNLRNGTATEYTGNRDVREALQHLRQLGLLTADRPIDSINDNELVNLHDFIRLTPHGEEWAQRVASLGHG
jgi:hypothetical protein